MTQWFRDGQPCDAIAMNDRAVQYGDGLFETIAIRGRAPRLWDYHVERLQSGAERIGIAAPDATKLRAELDAALGQAQADTERCVAKILLSAGAGARGYRRDRHGMPSLFTGISGARRIADSAYRDGVELRLCRTRLALQPQLAGMKTLNRLEQVLARSEWRDDAVFEGLMLDTDGAVICGTMSNVFLVSGQQLLTPAITRCGVAGVMRRHALALIHNAGMSCQVRDIEVDELWAADGVFLSNSQFGLLPARRCGSHEWPIPDLFRTLAARLSDSGIHEGPA